MKLRFEFPNIRLDGRAGWNGQTEHTAGEIFCDCLLRPARPCRTRRRDEQKNSQSSIKIDILLSTTPTINTKL